MKISLYIPGITAPADGYEALTLEQIEVIDRASIKEIIVLYSLEHYPDMFNVIGLLLSKLQYNGIIILEGINLDAILRAYRYGEINSTALNTELYNGKKSVVSYLDIKNYLSQVGMIILKQYLNKFTYRITAQRPGVRNGSN